MPRVNPESDHSRREFWFLVVSGLLTLAFLASIQFQVSEPIDFDVYYHLAVARELLNHGPLQSFRWAPYSILTEHYADKEFLFHAVLTLLSGLDVTNQARWGAFFGQAFFAAAFVFAVWRLRVPAGWLFPVLVTATGSTIAIRYAMCRPHTWGAGFSVLIISLMLTRTRWRWLLLATFLYSLFHTGAWITAFYAGVWGFWSFVFPGEDGRRRIDWKPFAAVVSGWMLGQVIHPNFPDTFRLMVVQNFWVPYYATAAGNAALKAALGAELMVPGFRVMIEHWPVWALIAAMGAMLWSRPDARTRESLVAFTIALAFALVCSVAIRRLYEMAAPFTALAVAVVWRDWIRAGQTASGDTEDHRPPPRLLILCSVLILLLGGMSYASAMRQAPVVSAPLRMARWMARNVIEPQPVFTAQWADSAPLLYFAPHLTTLVALDPTFFYAKDRELFIRYVDIVLGRTRNPVSEILDRFNARYITLWKLEAFRGFDQQLTKDPRAKIVYEDRAYRVWKIGTEPVREVK